ncbi:MAG: hypothetical protein KTR30_30720 [Saprospiraceae bacterium]|nr:hypothetical protein [Saprospiraceae bacterium]
MIALLVFFAHVGISWLLGRGLLAVFRSTSSSSPFYIQLLFGLSMETMLVFLLMINKVPHHLAFAITVAAAAVLNLPAVAKLKEVKVNLSQVLSSFRKQVKSLIWYEYLLIVLLFQKMGIVLWQLYRMPTFSSDAIKHWSTQARAIYGQWNFSLDAENSNFLGRQLQVVLDYPLQLPIWRANSALLNGGWNEFVSRSDGLLFFTLSILITYTLVKQLSGKRSWGLGAAYLLVSLPLMVWHGAAGYADIAVAVFLMATIASIIRKEWLYCGLCMGGAIWAKNDGFAVYLPGITAGLLVFLVFSKSENLIQRLKPLQHFATGLLIAVPWLVFQYIYFQSVALKLIAPLKNLLGELPKATLESPTLLGQVGPRFQDSPPSHQLFWDYVFTGPTHGLFWIGISLGFLLVAKQLYRVAEGKALLVFFLLTAFVIYYIFTFSPAYEYLLIQTTVHRTLLQFSGAALLVVAYGVSLSTVAKHTSPGAKSL